MTTISLAEAIKLKSIITKKIQRSAFVTVEKSAPIVTPVRTIAIIEAEQQLVRKDARTLDKLIYKEAFLTTFTICKLG
ncbi:hypothetical protein D3C72_2458210 [compost metagenome]